MTTSTKPAYTTNRSTNLSTMSNANDHVFEDEQIQRYDANTIKNRYGDNWRSLVSNVREVTQPDGSVIKEYIIEDPSFLGQMQNSSRPLDTNTSMPLSDREQSPEHQYEKYSTQQASNRNKFAEIKAKFESKHDYQVRGSPAASSSTASTRPNSHQLSDDLYAKHRRASHESAQSSRTNGESDSLASSRNSTGQTINSNRYDRSQLNGSERATSSSLRRLNSADEADEEVQRIHRQGEELRRYKQALSPISSSNEIPDQSRVQYEVVDEEGNPLAIDGIQNLIQMSGVRAREVTQPDGSIVKEYVIDDPNLLSKIRSQSQDGSPVGTKYMSQSNNDHGDAPPPPPRVPLRQPLLFRQGSASGDHFISNIQQIRVVEPHRRYEFISSTGRSIQFTITSVDNKTGQPISDADIRELTNAIDIRLGFDKPTQSPSKTASQTLFTHPKTWNPAVDFSQRAPPSRQRVGSDTQSGNYDPQHPVAYHQVAPDLVRSASYGALNQQPTYNAQYAYQQPYTAANGNWPAYQQQNFQGSFDPNVIRSGLNGTFPSTAQFLPQHQQSSQIMTKPMDSSLANSNGSHYYQQTSGYPYQGQQQQQQQQPLHIARFAQNTNGYDMSQARVADSNNRF